MDIEAIRAMVRKAHENQLQKESEAAKEFGGAICVNCAVCPCGNSNDSYGGPVCRLFHEVETYERPADLRELLRDLDKLGV